ncbi:MAG: hypothetical protein ABWZ25_10400 [Chitinophagaceae bacterium]
MKFRLAILALCFTQPLLAQQQAYFDAAQAYLKLMIEKGDATYTRVGGYKVIGTPYLYGANRLGSMYSSDDSVTNIHLSYNTYNQELGFNPVNSSINLVKDPGTVKYFIIQGDPAMYLPTDLKFVYGSEFGSEEKRYFQEVYKDQQYSLYKTYTSELRTPETSYVQADLRQFQIRVDYYYFDEKNKTLKKFKTTSRQILKEFSKIKDLSGQINENDLVVKKEFELTRLFMELNK